MITSWAAVLRAMIQAIRAVAGLAMLRYALNLLARLALGGRL